MMRYSLSTILVFYLVVLKVSAQTLPSGTINVPGTYPSIGNNQSIGSNTTLNVTSSSVGYNFSAGSSSGSNPNILVNISGGTIGNTFVVYRNVNANISGGNFGILFGAGNSSNVNISGGSFDAYFSASSGSRVNITGGSFGREFRARTGSEVSLFGGEFLLNGAPAGSNVTLANSDILTGTLQDGSTFIFSPTASDDIQNLRLFNVSVPPLNTAPIVINSNTSPRGLRAGQTLTLVDGGQLQKNFAVVSATLNIEGGTVQPGLEVTDSTVNISGGTVLSVVQALEDSVITVSGDAVAGGIYGYAGSEVNVEGGTLGDFSRVYSGSRFNISGGTIGSFLEVFSGGDLHILGGLVERGIEQHSGSSISLHGGEFLLNGLTVLGTVPLTSTDVISATLTDGSTIALSQRIGDALRQVTFVPEPLPPIDLTPITVTTSIGRTSLRTGQSLDLQPGGTLPSSFTSVSATLNVNGGSIGTALEIVDTTLNMTQGNIGSGFFALNESQVNIAGGTISSGFRIATGSTVSISGGSVGGTSDDGVQVIDGSVLNVTGGQVGRYVSVGSFGPSSGGIVNISGGTVADILFSASYNSVVNISGGTLGQTFNASSGSEINISGGTSSPNFDANAGSNVNLLGKQFILNGVDITNTLTAGVPLTITQRNVTLSGILGDGLPFSFTLNSSGAYYTSVFSPNATLTVSLLAGGDFDRDGDVDGRDFLVWQRNPSVGNLADWQSDYQSNLLAVTTAVPEPTAILLLAFSMAIASLRRVE
jgi:hypothetical protein